MKRVNLHIDRLVLRGVAPQEAGLLAETLRAELERQLADPSTVAALQGMPGVARQRLGAVSIPHQDGAGRAGALLAGRIVAGMKP